MKRVDLMTWGLLLAFLGLGAAGLALDYGFVGVQMDRALMSPGPDALLGTDRLGRDLLPRAVVATRGFFLPGLLAAGIAGIVGVGLGALSGYVPVSDGVDRQPTLLRLILDGLRAGVKLLLSLPSALPRFVSILLLCATFGFDAYLMAAAAGLLYAAELGEDVRQRVARCAREEYIEAARAEGVSTARLLGLHILWLHCRGLVIRHLLHVWAFVILVETSLSFMPGEFGIQEPTPSWGNMLVGAREPALTGNLWPSVVPTLAIIITIILLAWTGDRLARGRRARPLDASPVKAPEERA